MDTILFRLNLYQVIISCPTLVVKAMETPIDVSVLVQLFEIINRVTKTKQ